MPQDTCQNGKTEKSDDIELSHAWDPRTSRCVDVWHIRTSCYPHSTPRPRPATPSTSHGDLQQDTAASLPGKARLHSTLRMQHKPQKPLHRLRYPNAHLEGGLGRSQWNVKETNEAESGLVRKETHQTRWGGCQSRPRSAGSQEWKHLTKTFPSFWKSHQNLLWPIWKRTQLLSVW